MTSDDHERDALLRNTDTPNISVGVNAECLEETRPRTSRHAKTFNKFKIGLKQKLEMYVLAEKWANNGGAT